MRGRSTRMSGHVAGSTALKTDQLLQDLVSPAPSVDLEHRSNLKLEEQAIHSTLPRALLKLSESSLPGDQVYVFSS